MNKPDLKSLNFTVDRFFMKLFKTVNIEIQWSENARNALVLRRPVSSSTKDAANLSTSIMLPKIYCVKCVVTCVIIYLVLLCIFDYLFALYCFYIISAILR